MQLKQNNEQGNNNRELKPNTENNTVTSSQLRRGRVARFAAETRKGHIGKLQYD